MGNAGPGGQVPLRVSPGGRNPLQSTARRAMSHVTDRYQQFADSPPGRFMTRRLGLPQPADLRRGPELFDGPVLVGGGGSVRDRDCPDRARACAAPTPYYGADLRRHGRRALGARPARRLRLLPAGGARDLGAVGPRDRRRRDRRSARHRRSARSRASSARSARRSATARPRNLVYASGRRRSRVDAALPALRPLGLRVRAGRPGRRGRPPRAGRLGPAAGGPDRGGHRRVARHRRGDRRGARARRRPRRLPRRPGPGRGPDGDRQPHRRDRAAARHHVRRARRGVLAERHGGSTSSSTTPASRATRRSRA